MSQRSKDGSASESLNKQEQIPEATSTPANTSSAPPDGGLRAWSVVFGGFSALPWERVFQSYYSSHFLAQRSSSAISWIGSLQVFFLFLGGILSGPLTDRYGIRIVLIPSSASLVFSVMMVSLATRYYEFILAQGVLFGLACGMIFTPTVSTVGQYFTSKRAFAMGIVVSGASVGGVIFPIALNRLLNDTSLGFGWTIRIIGFIMLALMLCACVVMKEHAARRKHGFFLPEAFRSWPYVLTLMGFFFSLFGFWTPIFYIADYARARHVNARLAFYEVAILNSANLFGRTIPNFAADKIGSFNVNIIVTLCTAILLFCWTAAESTGAITVFNVLYGFFQGSLVSLISPCLARAVKKTPVRTLKSLLTLAIVCPKPNDIGTYIGMALAICSFGGLAGTPINGALITRYGFLSSSMFSGAFVLAGAGSYLAARLSLNSTITAKI
ncbi:MAG: hypothetical protein Q9191_002955 [Dirinaria sp. TL-2023a]